MLEIIFAPCTLTSSWVFKGEGSCASFIMTPDWNLSLRSLLMVSIAILAGLFVCCVYSLENPKVELGSLSNSPRTKTSGATRMEHDAATSLEHQSSSDRTNIDFVELSWLICTTPKQSQVVPAAPEAGQNCRQPMQLDMIVSIPQTHNMIVHELL